MSGIETFVIRAFPALLIVMWVGMSMLAAHVSGWHLLAQEYRHSGPVPDNMLKFRTITLRYFCGYNNIASFGVSPAGLRLAVFVLFRVGHPPLLIPWSDIEITDRKILWCRIKAMTARKVPRVPIMIHPDLAEKLKKMAGPYWRESPVQRNMA